MLIFIISLYRNLYLIMYANKFKIRFQKHIKYDTNREKTKKIRKGF